MGKMLRCSEGHFYNADKHSSCPICGVSGLNINGIDGTARDKLPEISYQSIPTKEKLPEVSYQSVAVKEKLPQVSHPSVAVKEKLPQVSHPSVPVKKNKKKLPEISVLSVPVKEKIPDSPVKSIPIKEKKLQGSPDSPVSTGPGKAGHKNHPQTLSSGVDGNRKTIGYWGKQLDPVVGWLVCIDGPDKGRDYRIRSEKNFIGRSPDMDIYIENDGQISRKKHAVISYNPRNNTFKLLPGDGRALVFLNGDDVEYAQVMNGHDLIEIGKSKFVFIPLCGKEFQWEEKNRGKIEEKNREIIEV